MSRLASGGEGMPVITYHSGRDVAAPARSPARSASKGVQEPLLALRAGGARLDRYRLFPPGNGENDASLPVVVPGTAPGSDPDGRRRRPLPAQAVRLAAMAG